MLNDRSDPVQDYSINKKRVGREPRSNRVMEEDCERATPCLGPSAGAASTMEAVVLQCCHLLESTVSGEVSDKQLRLIAQVINSRLWMIVQR